MTWNSTEDLIDPVNGKILNYLLPILFLLNRHIFVYSVQSEKGAGKILWGVIQKKVNSNIAAFPIIF